MLHSKIYERMSSPHRVSDTFLSGRPTGISIEYEWRSSKRERDPSEWTGLRQKVGPHVSSSGKNASVRACVCVDWYVSHPGKDGGGLRGAINILGATPWVTESRARRHPPELPTCHHLLLLHSVSRSPLSSNLRLTPLESSCARLCEKNSEVNPPHGKMSIGYCSKNDEVIKVILLLRISYMR